MESRSPVFLHLWIVGYKGRSRVPLWHWTRLIREAVSKLFSISQSCGEYSVLYGNILEWLKKGTFFKQLCKAAHTHRYVAPGWVWCIFVLLYQGGDSTRAVNWVSLCGCWRTYLQCVGDVAWCRGWEFPEDTQQALLVSGTDKATVHVKSQDRHDWISTHPSMQ